jgi:hypothetical protein
MDDRQKTTIARDRFLSACHVDHAGSGATRPARSYPKFVSSESHRGGLGQTGIIAQATLQLTPTKGDMMLVTEQRATNWDHHVVLLDGSDAQYTVGWIDATARRGRQRIEEAETADCARPHVAPRKSTNAPHWRSGPYRQSL